MRKLILAVNLLALGLISTSCTTLFGTKDDATVKDVLKQGAIDPSIITEQGYVPILPIWKGFINPVEVYVGYDQMIYVIDDLGLHILDQKGDEQRFIAISGASDVCQDRRLITYVTGRVLRKINDIEYSLPAIFRIKNSTLGSGAIMLDTLVHPFNDFSRSNTNIRALTDPLVEYTGITSLHDNSIYVSRKGPVNNLFGSAAPDNTVLVFDANGKNQGYTGGLSPVSSSLKSAMNVSAIASFAAPPQLQFGISQSSDFLLLQASPDAEYKALWIKQTIDPDQGPIYSENSDLLNFDTTKASRFLYDSFRFKDPADICVAPDGSGYIFIVDKGKDSLFVFNRLGYEGVIPPPNAGKTKQVNVSFGGKGPGPFQFNRPSGVSYLGRTVYVADAGNNRIMRYRLSSDIQR